MLLQLTDVEGKIQGAVINLGLSITKCRTGTKMSGQDNPTVLVEFLTFLVSAGGVCVHQNGQP